MEAGQQGQLCICIGAGPVETDAPTGACCSGWNLSLNSNEHTFVERWCCTEDKLVDAIDAGLIARDIA
eukprot:scaffold33104_cov18-Tisochrysis_lutea.AAC.2